MKQYFRRISALVPVLLLGISGWALDQVGGVYQIGSGEDLAAFADLVNSGNTNIDAVLTADIDMGEVTEAFRPIGSASNAYGGNFDGQGHRISNLRVNLEEDCAGLFGYVKAPSTFRNLVLDKTCAISGNSYCGLIGESIADAYGDIYMENLGNEGSVKGTGMNVGGIVGCNMREAATFHINNCYTTGPVSASQWAGAISGWVGNNATIDNCWSTAEVTGCWPNEYFFFFGSYQMNNCYCTGGTQTARLTNAMMTSGELCYLLNLGNEDTVWYQTLEEDPMPVLDPTHGKVYTSSEVGCDGKITGNGVFTNDASQQSTRPAHQYENGKCVTCGKADPDFMTIKDGYYQIGNAQQLLAFAYMVNNGQPNINGQLTADINMEGYNENFRPIGNADYSYGGTFDGQGHHISNLFIDLNEDCVGLFGYVKAPSAFRNLILDSSCTIYGNNYCGLIGESIAGAYGDIYMENLGNEGTVAGTGMNVGAIIGCNMREAATYHLSNCYSTGNISARQWAGAISGWVGRNATMDNCWSTAEVSGCIDSEYFCFYESYKMNNCYCTGGNQTLPLTIEQVENGELCWNLTGGNPEGEWRQTLGEDAHPVFDITHKPVYSLSHYKCDGTLDGTPQFTNEYSEKPVVPDHQYVNGFCTVCGQGDPNFMQLVDGYYIITSAAELVVFSDMVNNGQTNIYGKLSEDIDMTGYCSKFRPIGTAACPYNGEFDGQGHVISNLILELDEDCVGLFGYVAAPCAFRNLTLDNTCSLSGRSYCGLIGESVAGAYGDIYMENLGNEGPVWGTGMNVGGIIGCNMREAATYHINNCYTTGPVSANQWAGAISGWVGNNATINNCWSTAEVTGCWPNEYFFFFGSYEQHNCYCTGGTQVPLFDASELATGAFAFRMNGDQTKITWYQTLGEDQHPVPNPTHGTVILAGEDQYFCFDDENTFSGAKENYLSTETDYILTIVAEKKLTDNYLEQLELMADSESQDGFMTAYVQRLSERKAIFASASAYKAYMDKVAEIKAYLEENDGFPGPDRDLLSEYLEYDYEPDEDYPNGTYAYIIDESNRQLDAQQILAEAEYVEQLLKRAIQRGYQKDDEVTGCLVNADFKDGMNGWIVEGGKPTVDGLSGYPLAVEFWNTSFDMYQTVEGLKNGVYELQVNADERFADDLMSMNHTAFVYADGNCTYLPMQCEDAQNELTAEDMVNCYITEGAFATDYKISDETNNTEGYVPVGPLGHSVAFSADRYHSTMLAYVTDGKLTIGVRNPGMGKTIGTWIGNVRLFYRGALEEATASMDAVLDCQKQRAAALCAAEPSTDYSMMPNFSQALRDKIEKTIQAVDAADDAAAKYALIQEFSTLFQEAYECKKAYIAYMNRLEGFLEGFNPLMGVLSQEQGDEIFALYEKSGSLYTNGLLDTKDALDARFAQQLSIYPRMENGSFILSTSLDMLAYSAIVNSGQTDAKGTMTADIDMTELSKGFRPIGSVIHPFSGTFDGQGHHISGLVVELDEDCAGLFGYVAAPCAIRNLVLDKTCAISGNSYCGLIGESIADAYGDIYMENLGNEGSVKGTGMNVGGIVGCNMREAATFHINNCYTTGPVSANQWAGAISGWVGFNATIDNCWSTAEVTGCWPNEYFFFFGSYQMNNSYCTGGTQTLPLTTEQVTNGELCFFLNQGNNETIWFQNLGEDMHPVFDTTHQQVVLTADGSYSNNTDLDGVKRPEADTRMKGSIYNLSGQRVSKTAHGLYIVDGKKMWVK